MRNQGKECAMPGCPGYARTKGLCSRCYQAMRQGRLKKLFAKPCSTPGCDEKVHAKGLCNCCYQKKWRGTDPAAPRKAPGPAPVPVPVPTRDHIAERRQALENEQRRLRQTYEKAGMPVWQRVQYRERLREIEVLLERLDEEVSQHADQGQEQVA